MKLAVVYCRVSTEDQEREGTSLLTQREACLKVAHGEGYEVPPELVFLETFSGLTRVRPLFEKALELIRRKEAQAFICHCLDRLSRDPVDTIVIQDAIEKAGARLLLVTETVESSDLGRLVTHIRGFAAKLEAVKIRERTARGRTDRVLTYGKLPSGGRLYGYIYRPGHCRQGGGTREVDLLTAPVVREIYELVAQGHSLRSTVARLNRAGVPSPRGKEWSSTAIRRIATNPAYKGEPVAYRKRAGKPLPEDEWVKLPAEVAPAIVTPELWQAANTELREHKPIVRATPFPYLLAGRIFCGICGKRMAGNFWRRGRRTYRYYECPHEPRCQPFIRADGIEEAVWAEVVKVLSDPQTALAEVRAKLQEGTAPVQERLREAEAALREAQRREAKLADILRAVMDDRLPLEVLEREARLVAQDKEKWACEVGHLRNLFAREEAWLAQAQETLRCEELVKAIGKRLEEFNAEEKRLALAALGIRLTTTAEQVTLDGVIPTLARPNIRELEHSSGRASGDSASKRQCPR
jgi:site-specific DNA recombinase